MMTSSNHKLSILARMRTTSLALSVVLGLIFISSAAVVDFDVTAQNYDADDNDLVLTPSDNLTLRCAGNAPLTWLRNGQSVTLTPGRRFVLTTTKTADSNNSGAWFESELKITGLTYQDTGEITCRYINSSVIRQRTVHIFVYDGLNLMAIVSKTLLSYSVVAGRSAIIECKPTHPNITIRLLYINTDVTERVKFDRHKGFVISNVTQFFHGMFSCRAELANTSQSVTVAVAYQEPFNTMVEVSSNVSNNEVMVGESFYIECRAHARTTDSVVYMSWKFNATKTGGRISTSRATMSSKVARSVLTVRNASLSDQGSYQCSANAVESRESTKQLYIVVHEKAFATLSGSRHYEIDAMQKLNISVSVKAYPPNPELKWYKDGQLLQNDNNRRINYNRIQFSSVRAADAGNYTVVVHSSLVSSSFSFLLVLNVAPSVEIDQDIIGYYKEGQTYTFKCRGMGRPTPTMKWYWQPCLNDSCIATENGWTRVSMNPSPSENRIKEIRNGEETAVMGVVAELSGLYKCEGQNRLGTTPRVIQFFVPDKQEKAAWISIIITIPAAAAVGIIAVLCLFCLLCRSRKNRSKVYVTSFYDRFLLPAPILKGNTSESSGLLEQSEHLAYDPRWEFPKNRLVFKTKLGQGAFGTVVKALAIGVDDSRSATLVAVKMVKDEGNADQLKILASELKVLTNIGAHLNILNVLGAVTRDINKGQLYVIMEYCRYGCLRDFLINKRNDFVDTMNDLAKRRRALQSTADETAVLHSYNNENCINEEDNVDDDDEEELSPLTTKDLVCYSFQIARGMEFLASKKYIHGDLAARNILLATGNVVKICDFGLAKNCYKTSEYIKKSNTPVPVKWMAVESLTHRVYNMKTDVWSFGILLWELFTVGENPYATMTINENFVEIIKQGYRLEKPLYCNETTYMLMLQCWNLNPDYRPNFTELVDFFGNLLQASVRQHYTLLDTRYETPVAPSSCAPLNYIQIDVSSSSNSDAEADSLDDASSCPVTSIRQAFEDIDAGYRMPRAVRQCSVESGVFSVSNHRTSVSSRSDALTLMAPNGHRPRHRHDRAATASDSSSMEGDTTDPWSRKNDYILATPAAVTIADTTVDHRVEEDDNSRRVRLFDRQVATDNNNRCSRRSVTSDLSGSVVSDMAFDDRCRTPSGTPSGTPSTPSGAPSVYYGRNLPAFAVGEISVV